MSYKFCISVHVYENISSQVRVRGGTLIMPCMTESALLMSFRQETFRMKMCSELKALILYLIFIFICD